MTTKRNEQQLFGHDPELRRVLDSLTDGKPGADPLYVVAQDEHIPPLTSNGRENSPVEISSNHRTSDPRHFQSWTAPPGCLDAVNSVAANGRDVATATNLSTRPTVKVIRPREPAPPSGRAQPRPDPQAGHIADPNARAKRSRAARGLAILVVSIAFVVLALISLLKPERTRDSRAFAGSSAATVRQPVEQEPTAAASPRVIAQVAVPTILPSAPIVSASSDARPSARSQSLTVRKPRMATEERVRPVPAQPTAAPSALDLRPKNLEPVFARDPTHE